MKRLMTIVMVGLIYFGCTKPLELPDTKPNATILVVEGDVIAGNNAENTFYLSRLKTLQGKDSIPELNALIEIVSKDGTRWQVKQVGKGTYKSTLNIPTDKGISLRIQTVDGKVYETPYQTPLVTPAIDSVTYQQVNEGMKVFAHTHDPKNNTRYYRWTYEETWERHAWFETYHDYINGSIVDRPASNQIFACWKTAIAPTIILDNSTSLSNDVISYKNITTIPYLSEKLYVRYSILVRQIALSKEAYEFWSILRKNTELTGTLFDPQPSQLSTNITCTNDPSRSAIGYVSVGTIAEKRIFVMNSAMNLWPSKNPDDACESVELPSKTAAENFLKNYPTYTVAYLITQGGFGVAMKQCVDCRFNGGTTQKPIFW
jgi:hypothetical protein